MGRVYKSIRRAELGIDGTNVKTKRTSTMAPADRLDIRNSKEVNCTRKLISLQRTLRVSRKTFTTLPSQHLLFYTVYVKCQKRQIYTDYLHSNCVHPMSGDMASPKIESNLECQVQRVELGFAPSKMTISNSK